MATYPSGFIFANLAVHLGICSLMEENCEFRDRFFDNSQYNTVDIQAVTPGDFFATLPIYHDLFAELMYANLNVS